MIVPLGSVSKMFIFHFGWWNLRESVEMHWVSPNLRVGWKDVEWFFQKVFYFAVFSNFEARKTKCQRRSQGRRGSALEFRHTVFNDFNACFKNNLVCIQIWTFFFQKVSQVDHLSKKPTHPPTEVGNLWPLKKRSLIVASFCKLQKNILQATHIANNCEIR